MNFSDFSEFYTLSVISYLLFRLLCTILDTHPIKSQFFKIITDGICYLLLIVGLFGCLTVGAVEQFCYKRSEACHIVEKHLQEEDTKKRSSFMRRGY